MINKRCFLAIFATLFLSIFSSSLFADFLDDIVDEINFMRTRPQEYAEKRLIPILKAYKGLKVPCDDGRIITTKEGAAPCRECIEILKKQKPLPPLTMDGYLCKSAAMHMRDLRGKNRTGHQGSDGSRSWDRMERAGFKGTKWGENLTFGSRTPIDIVRDCMIDDGVPDRGHRENFLDPDFDRVGVAYAQGGKAVNGSVCVIDLGRIKKDSSDAPKYTKESDNNASNFSQNIDTILDDIIQEINYARTNPKDYALKRVTPRLKTYKGKDMRDLDGRVITTHEGAAPCKECIEVLKKQKPLPPLTMDKFLNRATGILVRDQQNTGRTGHEGSDGSSPWDRMERAGFKGRKMGENVTYGSLNAIDIVLDLMIDDGVPDRGHRKNFLDPEFDRIGVAYAQGGKCAYGSICVIDLGGGAKNTSTQKQNSGKKGGASEGMKGSNNDDWWDNGNYDNDDYDNYDYDDYIYDNGGDCDSGS